MKQMYLIFAIFLYSSMRFMAFGQSIGNVGNAVVDIPSDYQNDLWLNTNFREMNINDTYKIIARRVPEAIDNAISNNITLPNFNYSIVSGNSITINDSMITAVALGTSVVAVTYDALIANGKTYGASSDVNTTYIVINVLDKSIVTKLNIVSSFDIRSYDTYYFLNEAVEYTFSVTAANSDNIAVYCNGIEATKNNDDYTIILKNRANIIEVIASNASEEKKIYYVADARKVKMNIDNITSPKADIAPGSEVKVSFYGITIPVYKLATIYNPCMQAWGGEITRVKFDNTNLGTVSTNDASIGQYDIADYNSITMTLNEKGEYTFTNGRIYEMWWGSALGTEKDMTGPGNPNLNAVTLESDFSMLPDFTIKVKTPYIPTTFEDFSLAADTFFMQDVTNIALYATKIVSLTSGSYKFKNALSNWGGMTSWAGISISNLADTVTHGGVANQYNSAAKGDIENKGNYAVVYDANSGGMSMGPDYVISLELDKDIDAREISGCYITNNTYATNSMKNGDGFAGKFGGDEGTDPDWFKIIATGIDINGDITSTTEFYLADYRSTDNTLDYILEDWQWFDLSSLGVVSKVNFSLLSTDGGQYGMNTPSYFCIDNFDIKRLSTKDLLADVIGVEGKKIDIDLSNQFTDLADDSHIITKTVINNSSTSVVNATIVNNKLSLSYLSVGTSSLIIKGKYLGMSVTDTFTVTVIADQLPTVANPITDITVVANAVNSIISLTNVFTDADNDDALIVKSVKSNSNDAIVTANILGDNLTLSFTADEVGEAIIVVEGISNNKAITDTFTVTVIADQLPTVANSIADITVLKNAVNSIISLANVFTDTDNDDALIVKSVKSNSNDALLTVNILGDNLTLSFTTDAVGESIIVVEGMSNGKSVTDTFTVTVTSTIGINEISVEDVILYPNPSNGIFKIKLITDKSYNVDIYSRDGRLVYRNNTYMNSSEIDISNQPAGQYFIRINQGKSILTKSIVIIK